MSAQQADVIAFLSKAEAYGLRGARIERHETHGSIVFLAGDRAYKLKRAVKFDYMDYSTAEKRRAMCMAELGVNRRMAPELYLGVSAVLRDGGEGLHLGDPAPGLEPLDWLVVMRRFDQSQLLEQMRRSAKLGPAVLRAVGERIAAFHAGAEVRHDRGGASSIEAVIDESARILSQMVGRPFGHDKVERFDNLIRAKFREAAKLLDCRRADGHVRRVHGDLHLNNICLIDGRPVPFDAIEFNESFCVIDTLYDLAFLLMDLDRHGLCLGANALFNRYLERSGDYEGLALLPLFLSCRAAIRAHVTVTAAQVRGLPESGAWRGEAIDLLDRAIDYLSPLAPSLIAAGGLSGTGKSTFAYGLAPLIGSVPGAVVLRSDITRKTLWGIPETEQLPNEAYSKDFTDRVFETLARRTEMLLKSGRSVIADAVFGQDAQRRNIESAAHNAGAGFRGFWLEALPELLEQRIAARCGDASDATTAILHNQMDNIARPNDWQRLDAGCSAEELLGQGIRALGLSA